MITSTRQDTRKQDYVRLLTWFMKTLGLHHETLLDSKCQLRDVGRLGCTQTPAATAAFDSECLQYEHSSLYLTMSKRLFLGLKCCPREDENSRVTSLASYFHEEEERTVKKVFLMTLW